MEQAAALLRYRCRLVAFDDEIDPSKLREGHPDACMPILRYLFVSFSEALAEFLADSGHAFEPDMPDDELVRRALCAWPLISPHHALGGATAATVRGRGVVVVRSETWLWGGWCRTRRWRRRWRRRVALHV